MTGLPWDHPDADPVADLLAARDKAKKDYYGNRPVKSFREMSAAEFVAEMDRLHQPKDGPDGKVCITCDPAQGWKCITRVLLDSTVFPE